MSIKDRSKRILLTTVLRPPRVTHCSQTVYEALLGCCRIWEATGNPIWQSRATKLVNLLMQIQRPDGGFDIGYEFNFGLMHKKGDSTSPELVGLLGLCEYGRLFDADLVKPAATRAVSWIQRHALSRPNGEVAIPYSPLTVKEVMVYNGTSFACGALGAYIGQFGSNDSLQRIYSGMIRYLSNVMSSTEETPGRYWYYNDQSRFDLNAKSRSKIDYYHQMQQVEMHAISERAAPDVKQLRMVQDGADHVLALSQQYHILPYTNDARNFKGRIYLWGLASVAAGFIEAATILPQRKEVYSKAAHHILEWIADYAWNGKYFEAALEKDGARVSPSLYMVRSDAWVFNAYAAAIKYWGCEPWLQIAERCFQTMDAANFSGVESHASNFRTRSLSRLGALLLKSKR